MYLVIFGGELCAQNITVFLIKCKAMKAFFEVIETGVIAESVTDHTPVAATFCNEPVGVAHRSQSREILWITKDKQKSLQPIT